MHFSRNVCILQENFSNKKCRGRCDLQLMSLKQCCTAKNAHGRWRWSFQKRVFPLFRHENIILSQKCKYKTCSLHYYQQLLFKHFFHTTYRFENGARNSMKIPIIRLHATWLYILLARFNKDLIIYIIRNILTILICY